MKKDKDTWQDLAPDALLGYAVIVLCIVCFLLFLAALMAAVRFFAGAGAV